MRHEVSARTTLLLDFDGTVIDSVELIFECLDETARAQLGVPFPRTLWEEHIGKPLADTFALLGEHASQRSAELIVDYRRRQVACSDRVTAFPGMADALTELRRSGVRLAIVTTKLHRIAKEQLLLVGLADHFEVLIGVDDCERPKPDPQPFQLAMAALGVRPEECVAIGDTEHDIHGGRAAGALTAGALWSGVATDGLRAARPDLVLHHPQELLGLVRPARE